MFDLVIFGGTQLDGYEQRIANNERAEMSMLPLGRGGHYDPIGADERAPIFNDRLSCDFTVIGNSFTAIETTIYSFRALIGTKEKLIRKRVGSNAVEWIDARLTGFRADVQTGNGLFCPVRLEFALLGDGWHGQWHGHEAWLLDAGHHLDTGLVLDATGDLTTLVSNPQNITITNNGHRTIRNPVITVTAGDVDITSATFAITALGVELQFSGTVATGTILVIDCDAMTVKNNGSDAYSDLTLTGNHTISDWIVFAPGNNTLNVATTGNTPVSTEHTIQVKYSDGWI